MTKRYQPPIQPGMGRDGKILPSVQRVFDKAGFDPPPPPRPQPHPDFEIIRAGSTYGTPEWGEQFNDMPDYPEPDNSDEEPDQLAPGD